MLTAALAGALATLSLEWSNVRDYTLTIDAREFRGDRSRQQVLLYAYRRPHSARLEVLTGPGRGDVVVWRGEDRVIAYRRGLAIFSIRVKPSDERVTSLRGNGVLTPNFDKVLACFAGHSSRVSERPGPLIEGESTTAIELAHAGIACELDSPVDREGTRDVLYVSRKTGVPVRRERYAGARLVESWELRDLQLNPDLPDSMFP